MKWLLYKPLTQVISLTLLIVGSLFLLFGCSSLVEENKKLDYKIEMVSSLNDIKPNQQVEIVYKINDKEGNTLKDFDKMNEKIMHFIIIRKDLQYFQHIHPEFNKATGEFSIPVVFAANGKYRMFADFMPSISMKHEPVTVYKDVNVGNLANYKPEPLGEIVYTKRFNDYTIIITPSSESLFPNEDYQFIFEIKKGENPVIDLEDYLGALGHTVVLREEDLQFIHAHAIQKLDAQQTGKVAFMITFPKTGNYKLFSQFKHEGEIITSDFLVHVIEGNKNSPNGMMLHKEMKK